GRSLVDYLPDETQRATAAEIVGDAEVARENYAEAIRWYAKTAALAGEEDLTVLASKVDETLEQFDREQLLALLAEYPETFPKTQLETHIAKMDMKTGELSAAQERLQALLDRQPLHPLAATWTAMVEQINEWLQVDMSKVGCILPLSGPYQAYGDRVLRGLAMAAQDINESAGPGPGIQLVIKDSRGDADTSVTAVRELAIGQKVAAIIGPLSRVAAEATAREAQGLWVPIITLTQKKGVSEVGSYVFRDSLSNEQQTRALVEYAVLELGYTRFAILYPNGGYGLRLVNLFWDELARLGAEVRGVESYEANQTDYADQIKKLVGLYYPRPEMEPSDDSRVIVQPETLSAELEVAPEAPIEEEPLPIVDFEAIFVPDGYEKVGLIAPQLAYHDVTGVRLLGTNLWNSPRLLEMAAPYLQGAVFVDGFFPDSRLPRTRDFVRRYQSIFGEMPGYPEAQAYDTLRLLGEALGQPGVNSRPLLRDALLEIRGLLGVAGTASVTPGGEVSKPPFLITIQRRRMREIHIDFETLRQRRATWEVFTGTQGPRAPGASPSDRDKQETTADRQHNPQELDQ
ncbi:MAG: penicillin-binding protein activator, partial [Deltaproteobacteria bacterium]